MTRPVLILPESSKTSEVQCNACGDSIGAVLMQDGHPVAYKGRHLDPQECVLGIYEKELLAVIRALKIWRPELVGTRHSNPFTVVTDHRPLEYFMTKRFLNQRQSSTKQPHFIIP